MTNDEIDLGDFTVVEKLEQDDGGKVTS